MNANQESWSVERIKALTMQKIHDTAADRERPVPRRFPRSAAAAVAALALAFATTALALSGAIDFASIFRSVFQNESAAPYVRREVDIMMQTEEGELIVLPMGVFWEDSRIGGLYLDLEITDPVGGRLSDSLQLLYWNDWLGYEMINLYGEAYVRFIDDYTLHAGFWIPFVTGVGEGGELIVRIDAIASGVHWENEQATTFDIGAHIGLEKPVVLPEAAFIEITEITLEAGTLTITHRQSDAALYGWGQASIGIMKPDGSISWSFFTSGTLDVPGQRSTFHVGDVDPADLTLLWQGLRADHTMTGFWEISFPGEAVLETRIIDGTVEGAPAQVILGGTTVELQIFAGFFDIFGEKRLILHLIDGTTVEPRFNGAEGGSDMATVQYSMDFIHPEDVVRVTFRGVQIYP